MFFLFIQILICSRINSCTNKISFADLNGALFHDEIVNEQRNLLLILNKMIQFTDQCKNACLALENKMPELQDVHNLIRLDASSLRVDTEEALFYLTAAKREKLCMFREIFHCFRNFRQRTASSLALNGPGYVYAILREKNTLNLTGSASVSNISIKLHLGSIHDVCVASIPYFTLCKNILMDTPNKCPPSLRNITGTDKLEKYFSTADTHHADPRWPALTEARNLTYYATLYLYRLETLIDFLLTDRTQIQISTCEQYLTAVQNGQEQLNS